MRNDDTGGWQARRHLPRVGEVLGMIRAPRRGLSRRQRRLADAADIGDLRDLARRRAPKPMFDFIAGGAGDEVALRRNTDTFRAVRFVPRALRDVGAVDTSVELLGRTAALPIVLAPIGMMRIGHAHGEIGSARAAARAGIPWVMSTMASTTLEDVSAHATDTDRWFQLYLWRDRTASERLLARAAAAGFTTLVLTVDVPVAGARLRDLRNGMTIPPSLTPSSVAHIARRPGWWVDALTREPIKNLALETARGGFIDRTNAVMDPSVTLDQLAVLRGLWPGSILVKGILDARDARTVLEAGADGVIVSNHGGRQLENAVAPLEVLPEIRQAVGADAVVLIDGGIESGAHVVAAVAAGASAVLVGRAYVYGLMAGGEQGVDRAIQILGDGVRRTMALLGAPRIADLEPSMVRL